MIRINLLPGKKSKRHSAGQQQIILFVLVLVLIGVTFFYLKGEEDDAIAALQKKKVGIENEAKRLEEIIGDISKQQKQKDELTKKLDIIKLLERGKTGPVRILDELSTVIPKKVWLVSLVDVGGKLQMEGYATGGKEVASFMKNLRASKYFSDVNLISMVKAEYPAADFPVMKFSLNCKYRLPRL